MAVSAGALEPGRTIFAPGRCGLAARPSLLPVALVDRCHVPPPPPPIFEPDPTATRIHPPGPNGMLLGKAGPGGVGIMECRRPGHADVRLFADLPAPSAADPHGRHLVDTGVDLRVYNLSDNDPVSPHAWVMIGSFNGVPYVVAEICRGFGTPAGDIGCSEGSLALEDSLGPASSSLSLGEG